MFQGYLFSVKYVPLELIFYEIGSTETYVTDFYEICSRME